MKISKNILLIILVCLILTSLADYVYASTEEKGEHCDTGYDGVVDITTWKTQTFTIGANGPINCHFNMTKFRLFTDNPISKLNLTFFLAPDDVFTGPVLATGEADTIDYGWMNVSVSYLFRYGIKYGVNITLADVDNVGIRLTDMNIYGGGRFYPGVAYTDCYFQIYGCCINEINVKVKDTSNNPLENAYVYLNDSVTEGYTDKFGWSNFTDVVQDIYLLTVEKNGYYSHSETIEFNEHSDIIIVLEAITTPLQIALSQTTSILALTFTIQIFTMLLLILSKGKTRELVKKYVKYPLIVCLIIQILILIYMLVTL